MSTQTDSFLTRIRQPEYTGENRCTPCTVVNVAIAIVCSTIIAIVSPLLAPVAFGTFLTVIYLRGYLVSGTPQLTKRYFPERVLRWFDKAPERADAGLIGATDEVERIDSGPILLEADVLEFTPAGTDLQLTEEFQTEWGEHMEAVRGSSYELQLARVLSANEDVDPEGLEVWTEDRNVTAFRDDTPVAVWTSEAALIADAAAVPLLQERLSDWKHMNLGVRGQFLHGVRVFLKRCPSCGGDLALSDETVESCCRTVEVATLTCSGCEARLLEVEV